MTKPTVLFLCSHNSARSQMAEAILRWHAGDRMEVHSAGLDPQDIHHLTKVVLNEVGLDISGHRSKSVKEFLGKLSISHAIFVCEQAEARCPTIYPFALTRLSWPFEDPAAGPTELESQLKRFREIRDQIEAKILGWLADR